MELGVSHVQNLSSLTPIVDNIFDKYNKKICYPQDLFQIMTYSPPNGIMSSWMYHFYNREQNEPGSYLQI